jgi:hypothetical protein
MLYLSINKKMPNEISLPDIYLGSVVRRTWFDDSVVKQMILDVDKTVCHSAFNMESPMLGGINYNQLSTGVKNLILAYKLDNPVIDLSLCGDNCSKWIIEISKQKDIIADLYHVMLFDENTEFNCILLNDNTIIKTLHDYSNAIMKYLLLDSGDKNERKL